MDKKILRRRIFKKLIITYDKSLLSGNLNFLVDDSINNGQLEFGEGLIQYGTEEYPDMETVYDKITKRSNL